MRLLCVGDPHLRGTGATPEFSGFAPKDVDLVVCVGDVVDDDGAAAHERGRAFYAALDEVGVPVAAVPGEHDAAVHADLLDGAERVVDVHGRVVPASTLRGSRAPLDGVTLVGWGCPTPGDVTTFPYTAYPGLDPADPDGRYGPGHGAADRVAADVEAALDAFVRGGADVEDVRGRLDLPRDVGDRLEGDLAAVAERYRTVADLLAAPRGDVLLLTHVPPFNTAVDVPEGGSDAGHRGSVALKLALEAYRPLLAVSGHTHAGGYDALAGEPATHLLGLPSRRVVDVDLDRGERSLTYTTH